MTLEILSKIDDEWLKKEVSNEKKYFNMSLMSRLQLISGYASCSVCNKVMKGYLISLALHQHQKKTCSVNCSKSRMLEIYGCCEKADLTNCVCRVATLCPEHGKRCTGGHD